MNATPKIHSLWLLLLLLAHGLAFAAPYGMISACHVAREAECAREPPATPAQVSRQCCCWPPRRRRPTADPARVTV